MDITASSLAVELKRQIDKKVPSGAAARNFAVKASVTANVGSAVYFEAVGLLLEQLAGQYPEWEIGLEGEPDDLQITFSR